MSDDPFILKGKQRLAEIAVAASALYAEANEISENLKAICKHPTVHQDWVRWSSSDEYGGWGYHPEYTCIACNLRETGWTPQKLRETSGRTIVELKRSAAADRWFKHGY